jgi:hypothetical protein
MRATNPRRDTDECPCGMTRLPEQLNESFEKPATTSPQRAD